MNGSTEAAHDYRVVLDAFADAVIAANGEGRVVYVNHAAEILLGWTAEELVDQPLTVIQPARMRELHAAGFARFITTRVPKLIGQPVRLPALRRDGTEIDIELALSVVDVESSVPGDEGNGLLFVAALRDLSDRIELERQIAITRYLRATNEAAARLAGQPDSHAVLRTAVETLNRDYDAALAQAWLFEPRTHSLRLQASAGLSANIGSDRIDLDTETGMVGEVARTRQPFTRNNRSGDLRFDTAWAVDEGIAGVAIFPLLTADELHGVLAYFSRQVLPDEVIETLANFAALTAASLAGIERLERARVARADAERAEQRAAYLAEASTALGGSLNSNETLHRLAQLAVPMLGEWSMLDALDPKTGAVRRIASESVTIPTYGGGTDPSVAITAALGVLSDPLPVIQSGKPELVTQLDANGAGKGSRAQITSYLRVPLRFRGKSFAALTLVMCGPGRRLGPADLHVAEELAERASLAFEHAWLFEEQARAINRIQQLATEHRLVLSQIADGVIITDEAGHITFANDAAHRLHGGVKIGSSVRDYGRIYDIRTLAGQPVAPDQLALTKALTTHTPTYNAERRIRRADGSEVIVLVSAIPLVREDRRFRGAVLTQRDVTEIHEISRQRDQFVIGASHDLKTPLTGIKGWAQLLLQRADRNEHLARERTALDAIYVQAEAMHRLLDRMLDAIRLQTEESQTPTLSQLTFMSLLPVSLPCIRVGRRLTRYGCWALARAR
ncbi:MAG TPA: PAS domain S-box protein [Thermomicrobiales bacterium]|nr:PAS domain S-box protein [Thermomicrobiales bacterium]